MNRNPFVVVASKGFLSISVGKCRTMKGYVAKIHVTIMVDMTNLFDNMEEKCYENK